LTGRQTHLAVIADSERALGRPERAIDIYRTAERSKLAPDEAAELLIVAAGARGDLGQRDAAVAMLQVRELTAPSREPWVARLRYAYAESLLAAGRRDEAREWFARAADIDDELATDAAERMLELDGVVLDDVDVAFEDEDELDDTDDEEAVLDDVDEDEDEDEDLVDVDVDVDERADERADEDEDLAATAVGSEDEDEDEDEDEARDVDAVSAHETDRGEKTDDLGERGPDRRGDDDR
jgi:tetratricopeptide (TPR) repeat protein